MRKAVVKRVDMIEYVCRGERGEKIVLFLVEWRGKIEGRGTIFLLLGGKEENRSNQGERKARSFRLGRNEV